VGFEPGVILIPFTVLTLFGADVRRRSVATLCLLCAATVFFLLTISQTKIYWYATPILPFLAIATALGITDGLRWIKAREPHLPKLFRTRPLQIALGILLAAASAASLYRNHVMEPRTAEQAVNAQLWYGALFDELKAHGNASVIVIDGGLRGNYNPVLKFSADIAGMNGLQIALPAFDTIPSDVITHAGASEGVRNYNPYADIAQSVRVETPPLLPTGDLVATCDPKLVSWFRQRDGFLLDGQVHFCIFGVLSKPRSGQG
jgi:hypothetical protein